MADDLVVTSAHLIFKLIGSKRSKAIKIQVLNGHKVINAHYCSDFEGKFARENDYALLRL